MNISATTPNVNAAADVPIPPNLHDVEGLTPAEQARAHLAAIVDSSDDAIISKNLDGIITSWNTGAQRLFGYSASEAIGRPVLMLIPPERHDEEPRILKRLRRGERVEHFETVRVRKDGARLDISLTISPVRDSRGRIIGASKIARDVTERKSIERELERHRHHLQELVEQRTAELADTQQKLMAAERITALGTIAAGLGHDIGNLMMPMAAHLAALEAACERGEADVLRTRGATHFQAMRKSFEYLRDLAGGLRMMAIDPARRDGGAQPALDIAAWLDETRPLLEAALTGRLPLERDVPADLPPVAIARHLLTQTVFNLVQNAGQALQGRSDGLVRIAARRSDDGQAVHLRVCDNGPGMSKTVRQRCVEPFFTTKVRGISSGLGLALVHGIVQEVGGRLEIESEPDRGATFTLVLPLASAATRNGAMHAETRLRAVVDVDKPRLRALAHHALAAASFERRQRHDESDQAPPPHLMVIDDRPEAWGWAAGVLQREPDVQVVVLSSAAASQPDFAASPRVTAIDPESSLEALRQAFRNLAAALSASIAASSAPAPAATVPARSP